MHLATRCIATLALCVSVHAQAAAQSTPASDNALLQHALAQQDDALQFKVGRSAYQVVPDAALVPRTDTEDDATARRATNTATADNAIVATLGPYAITLQAGNARRAASTSGIGIDGTGVAVNLRSGQPALIKPQLELHTAEAGQGKALAQALGASLVFDGPASRIVILQFDSIPAALAALPQARAHSGITHAQPVLQHDFKTRR